VDNIGINGDTITASGDLALVATGNDITVDTDNFILDSSTADSPTIKLLNTTDDNEGSRLIFEKLRADDGIASGQNIGEIWFRGQDSGQNTEDYAYIVGEIDVSTSGQESGQLKFGLANHDGGNGNGLILTGGSADNEIDVTVGLGAASVTTITGTLTMGSTAAMTNAGLVTVADQSNIRGLGTISTGVWQGTAIATAYIADDAVTEDKLANTLLAEIDANTAKNTNRAYFEFKGYGSSDGTNYEMPEIISDTNAPFEHNTSTGSDGLTAQATTIVMRQGGIVMPYTGTLKKFTGWVTTQGTGTVDVGIFKFTPVDNNAGNVTPVLLVNEQITGAGNTKMRSFSETSSFDAGFTAGDIIYSAVLGSGSSKSWYLNSMLEVEWS
jgi:hypothetical protein